MQLINFETIKHAILELQYARGPNHAVTLNHVHKALELLQGNAGTPARSEPQYLLERERNAYKTALENIASYALSVRVDRLDDTKEFALQTVDWCDGLLEQCTIAEKLIEGTAGTPARQIKDIIQPADLISTLAETPIISEDEIRAALTHNASWPRELELLIRKRASERLAPMINVMYRAAMEVADFDEPESKPTGWQPIATAPRDGTVIDLWMPQTSRRCVNCYWGRPQHSCGENEGYCDACPDHDGWVDGEDFIMGYTTEEPSHWMPRPAAPRPQVS